jgi:hypothetical protein
VEEQAKAAAAALAASQKEATPATANPERAVSPNGVGEHPETPPPPSQQQPS